jgi:uncharacterized membrane protein YfcA
LSIIMPPRDRGGMTVVSSTFAFIIFTFLLAGIVKGAIGLGLPTVSVGLLGLVMAPAQAAALLVVPSLVTNVWQLAAGPRFGPLARRLGTMMVGICLGSWAGVGLLTADRSGHATTALGLALAAYAIVGLSGMRLAVPARAEPWISPAIGAITGLVSGATGVFVIPAVPYLQALDLEKEELVQALGLSFTVSTTALAIGLAQAGAFQPAPSAFDLPAPAPATATATAGAVTAPRAAEFSPLAFAPPPSALSPFALSLFALPPFALPSSALSPFALSPLALSLLALAPALAGMALGQWIRTRARPETFRRGFFMALLLLGAHLCLR